MKALAALAGAAITVAACYGLGAIFASRLGARLRRDEKFPLAFVLGAAILHLLIIAVMALHIAYRPVLIGLLAACVSAALITGDWGLPAAAPQETPLPRAVRYLLGAIAAAFTVLYLFNAWAPEISPDGSSYHLTPVALYLQAHGFKPVLTNVYSTLSGGVDVLAWALQGIPYKAALRIVPEERYLHDRFEYRWARLIEERVPPGARVLVRSLVATVYTSRDVLIGYEGAFNEELQDLLDVDWDPSSQSRKLWAYSFPERRLRRLRVVQTGTAKIPEEQWDVHELRFFHAGVELPRLPEWRLQARPNPWGVQTAFDNSAATRWRSWETLHPDMSIEVDFGREQPVDQVRVELSDIDWNVRMRVDAMEANGVWTPLPASEELRQTQYAGSVRRAAAFELHARGVDYVLLKDSDWGAKELAQDPASWGMTRLVYESGASLYKVNPPEVNP